MPGCPLSYGKKLDDWSGNVKPRARNLTYARIEIKRLFRVTTGGVMRRDRIQHLCLCLSAWHTGTTIYSQKQRAGPCHFSERPKRFVWPSSRSRHGPSLPLRPGTSHPQTIRVPVATIGRGTGGYLAISPSGKTPTLRGKGASGPRIRKLYTPEGAGITLRRGWHDFKRRWHRTLPAPDNGGYSESHARPVDSWDGHFSNPPPCGGLA